MGKIKVTEIIKCFQEYGESRADYIVAGNIYTKLHGKVVLSCLKNIKHILAMLPSNSTSKYLPSSSKTNGHTQRLLCER